MANTKSWNGALKEATGEKGARGQDKSRTRRDILREGHQMAGSPSKGGLLTELIVGING